MHCVFFCIYLIKMYIMFDIVNFKNVITFTVFYACESSYTKNKVTLKTQKKKNINKFLFYKQTNIYFTVLL